MSTQPEAILESELIQQLAKNGYQKVLVEDEDSLIANLKNQLEKLNKLRVQLKIQINKKILTNPLGR